jgi:hypothetical protein
MCNFIRDQRWRTKVFRTNMDSNILIILSGEIKLTFCKIISMQQVCHMTAICDKIPTKAPSPPSQHYLHSTLYRGSRHVAVFENSTWSAPLKLLQLPSRLLMARHLNELAWLFCVGSRTETETATNSNSISTLTVKWCKWTLHQYTDSEVVQVDTASVH